MSIMGLELFPYLCELAHSYCRLSVTNDGLAEFFGVSPRTIDNWIAGHPGFPEAVQQGRDVADAIMVESLFTRVTGYDHQPEEKVFVHHGQPRMATYSAHRPPETRACLPLACGNCGNPRSGRTTRRPDRAMIAQWHRRPRPVGFGLRHLHDGPQVAQGDVAGALKSYHKSQRNIILKGADAATRGGFTQVPNFLLKSKNLSAGDKLA